jgi:hypothetical protein
MQDYVAPAVDGVINFGARTERGDDHEDLVRFARGHVRIEPRIRPMHNPVDRVRGK